jgi:hypothetical protein
LKGHTEFGKEGVFVIRNISIQITILVLLCFLLIPTSEADRLLFRDGTEIKGRVVSKDNRMITFATKIDGKLTVQKYDRAQVKMIVPESEEKNNPFLDPTTSEKKLIAPKRPGLKATRVIFMIDRSGSMGLAKRLENSLKKAQAMALTYTGNIRLQIFAFDDRAAPIQPDFANVVPENKGVFESALRKITVAKRAGTNFEAALKRVFAAQPDVIHIFSDGVERARTGGDYTHMLKVINRMNRGHARICTHLFQSGSINYFGGEPLNKARKFLTQLAETNKGQVSLYPDKIPAKSNKIGAKIIVTSAGKEVTSITLGQRYKVHLIIDGISTSTAVDEYLSGSSILIRSVDSTKRDIARRIDLPLGMVGTKINSRYPIKIVAKNNRYAQAKGYVAAESNGTVAFFFDALGQWVSLKLPVK